jgi:hypothetical protein
MYLLNATSILSIFIASVLGFYVAPHLSLVSRDAGRAMRFAAWSLGLGLALDFAMPFLMARMSSWPLPIEPWRLTAPIAATLFWGCLAWSVLALMQTAKPKGLL